jgi:hypothetical protein
MKRVSIFLIAVALIAGMVGSDGVSGGDTLLPSQNLEIQDWYDLDNVRNNLAGNHTLINDLDSTSAGYEELASPTANQGKGWEPIGFFSYGYSHGGFGCGTTGMMWHGLTGTFDGQSYEIHDLFIKRPDESDVGLFGLVNEGGVIKNVGVVSATVTGKVAVGGLVGDNGGTVSNSYFNGSVTGDKYVGGLLGINYDTVSNSYSTGTVIGNSSIGGLVGLNYGTVSNSYSTGIVTGNSSVGGLVGWNYETVSNSFWDTQTSGQASSDGGTGKTTAEMRSISTFSGAGWNIIAVANPGTRNTTHTWNIVDGVTYPFLSWQPIS